MATKAQKTAERAAEKTRIIAEAGKLIAGDDALFLCIKDAKVSKSPDGYWVAAWIRVPLDAAEEKKTGSK